MNPNLHTEIRQEVTLKMNFVKQYRNEETRTFQDITRNHILQVSYSIMTTESYEIDHVRTNNSLGNTHNIDQLMMSPQIEVCISRKMMTSNDDTHGPSIELSNNYTLHTNDTQNIG